jgi:hypothetical protein
MLAGTFCPNFGSTHPCVIVLTLIHHQNNITGYSVSAVLPELEIYMVN